MTEIPEFAALLEEIVGSQHHRSFSVDWPFEELTRCSLLNRIAQPKKLIYSLICLHLMLAFKIVHRRGRALTAAGTAIRSPLEFDLVQQGRTTILAVRSRGDGDTVMRALR